MKNYFFLLLSFIFINGLYSQIKAGPSILGTWYKEHDKSTVNFPIYEYVTYEGNSENLLEETRETNKYGKNILCGVVQTLYKLKGINASHDETNIKQASPQLWFFPDRSKYLIVEPLGDASPTSEVVKLFNDRSDTSKKIAELSESYRVKIISLTDTLLETSVPNFVKLADKFSKLPKYDEMSASTKKGYMNLFISTNDIPYLKSKYRKQEEVIPIETMYDYISIDVANNQLAEKMGIPYQDGLSDSVREMTLSFQEVLNKNAK